MDQFLMVILLTEFSFQEMNLLGEKTMLMALNLSSHLRKED